MFKKLFLLAMVVMIGAAAHAQFKVKTIIDALPPKHPDDALYLMGDFNQWNPNDPNAQFVKDASGKYVLSSDGVPANTYEIKVTRGSAQTVECAADGKPIGNRKVVVSSDTTFYLTVAGWTDDFPKTTGYLKR
jgi:hypothetical protein